MPTSSEASRTSFDGFVVNSGEPWANATMFDTSAVPIFTGQNYSAWKLKFQVLMMERGLWGFFDGTEKKPDNDSDIAEWKKDQKAFATLISRIGINLMSSMRMCIKLEASVHEAWKRLEMMHVNKTLHGKILARNAFYMVKMRAGESMHEYATRVEELGETFMDLDGTVTEEDWILTLLCGLPEEWSTVITTLDSVQDTWTKEMVVGQLLHEESRRRRFANECECAAMFSGGSSGKKFTWSKGAMKKSSGGSDRGKGNASNGSSKCHYCGKAGHFWRECRKHPSDWTPSKARNHEGNAHTASGDADDSRESIVLLVGDGTNTPSGAWFLDTGETQHMTHSALFLTNVGAPGDVTRIVFGNDKSLPVVGVGSTHLIVNGGPVDITNVLHVPGLKVDLLSVTQLTKKGVKVTIDDAKMNLFWKGKQFAQDPSPLGLGHGPSPLGPGPTVDPRPREPPLPARPSTLQLANRPCSPPRHPCYSASRPLRPSHCPLLLPVLCSALPCFSSLCSDTWLDDLQLYLLSDSRDSFSLFDHTSGAAPAPPATADSATRSQWLTRNAAALLAIRNHLPLAECAHFGQHRTAQALYDAVVARYSLPATAVLGRLLLPYLFPELSAFATVEDLVSHLRTSNARYRAAAPAEFLDRNQPPMFITLYCIVTRLPESLRSVRDHFLSLAPTLLTIDQLKQHLTCGKPHTKHRCFSRLDDAWRAEFGDKAEHPYWAELLRSGVAIFDLNYDAILFAMYALSASAEGDCYRCVPPDPGIEAAALGASESSLPSTVHAEALHTFMLDSGASRCFFRDNTTLTPLPAPVPVRLADPSRGPVVARSSTVLPCPAVPSGSLSGLHLPSFSTNLVSTAALQDSMVTTTTPGGQRVSICTCTRTGRHLATFTRRPGSSLYTLATEPPHVAASAQVSASGQEAPPCSCRLLSHQTLLWHHRLGHPSLPNLRGMHSRLLVSGLPRSLPPLLPSPAPPCLPCIEGRQRAAPHSSSFPPTTAPLQTLHMDV
ncbi:unnamed protein product, partial [Closterium sp. NIES-53]